jgi:MoxR-like ATPase
MILSAILARGHVLLEGLPGLGKTALVNCLGKLLDLDFKRIQFTPDLMPGDILGSHILQEIGGGREMRFTPGPVFTNIVLADEINRASPKTQSALLEAMQEKTVTLLGEQMTLPSPFFVLATQNPIELEGTYPLPEAQIDRFLFKLELQSPDERALEKIITERHRGEIPQLTQILDREDLDFAFSIVDRIFIPDAVASFIAKIVSSTLPEKKIAGISEFIRYGASPRAAIAIAEAARGAALIDGRPGVGFADIENVAHWALHHRIITDYRARAEKITTLEIVSRIMKQTNRVPCDPRAIIAKK